MKSLATHTIKLAVTIGILFAIFHKIGMASVVEQFGRLPAWCIVFCGILVLGQQWVVADRFSEVVRLCGGDLDRRSSLRVTLESMFFGQAFISILGSDIFRAWRLRRFGFPIANIAQAVIFDRLNGLAVNHLLLVLSILPVLPLIRDQGVRLSAVAIAVGGAAILVLVIGFGFLADRLRGPDAFRVMAAQSLLTSVATEIAVVGRFFSHGERVVGISLASLVSGVINIALLFTLLVAMAVPIDLALACALLTPLLIEVAMLPVSIAGWGIREGAAALLYGALGLDPERAVTAGVAFGLIGLFVGMLGGAVWLTGRFKVQESVEATKSPSAGE